MRHAHLFSLALRSRQEFFSIFFLFIFNFFIGLRHEIGGDWGNYKNLISYTIDLNLWQTLKITGHAYKFLNWLFNQSDHAIYFINFICVSMFVFGLGIFISRQPNWSLSFALAIPYLITAVAMGYTRQSVAIGFILLSFIELIDRNTKKLIIYVIIASMFHKTAVISFLLLPAIDRRFSIKRITWMCAICLPVAA